MSRGFTATEMLIVIGIIMVLVSIVAIALWALLEPAKNNATRATMAVLTNITRESLATKQAQDRFFGVQQWQITRVAPSGEEFFCSAPVQDYDLSDTDPTPQAFIQTQKVLYLLTRDPKARALFDSISADLKVKSKGIVASNGKEYLMSGLKKLDRDTGYVFRTAEEGLGNSTFGYPFPSYNQDELSPLPNSATPPKDLWVKLPLVVDSWGTPILYVADGFIDVNGTDGLWPDAVGSSATPNATNKLASTRGGLIHVKSDTTMLWWNVNGANAPAGYVQASIPGVSTTSNPNPPPILLDAVRASDRRPFWVSAGPDRKYETHDDNIYSFVD